MRTRTIVTFGINCIASSLVICALSLLLVGLSVIGCSSVIPSPQETTPQAPVPSPPPEVALQPTVSETNSSSEVPKGFVIEYATTVILPDVGQSDAWFVRRQDQDMMGVLVKLKGRTVTIRDPNPEAGAGLHGPEVGFVEKPWIDVRDLNQDGQYEVIIHGVAGRGPALWVYRYNSTAGEFSFDGDLLGKSIQEVTASDGTTTFIVHSVHWETGTEVETHWRWQPGGFQRLS